MAGSENYGGRPPRRRVLVIVVAAAVVAASVSRATAVEQTGDIAGRVHDDKGGPLPGSVVIVRGPNLQGERAAVTDREGEFAFKALPPGTYALEVRAPTYQPLELEGVLVHVGRSTPLDLTLSAGAQPEVVQVVGSIPSVDVVRSQTQDTYAEEYLEEAPITSDDRDYLSVAANSAGTSPGEDEEPSVRGGTRGENLYLIDGVDTTDPATGAAGTHFIFDAIQEVQVQTGGFSAEYGRASGGIVNVITKSGGNDLSGTIDLRYRNQRFIEKGRHFDPGQAVIEHEIAEATLGGPVMKDKLWFFVAGSDVRDDVGGEDFESIRRFRGRSYLGKITWRPSPRQSFLAQVTGDPSRTENVDAGPLTARQASSRQEQGSRFVSAQYQAALGSALIVHAQLAHDRARLDLVPESGDLRTVGRIDFASGRKTANATDIQTSTRLRSQASASLTWAVPDVAGDHTFKAGFDLQDLKYELDERSPGGEFDLVAPDAGGTVVPLAFNVVRSAGRSADAGRSFACFVQDEWRFTPQLSLTAGVRFDASVYENDRRRRVLTSRLLQPRAGISWDISGDARAVVKLTASRFGAPALLALPRVAGVRVNATDLFVNETIGGYFEGSGPTPVDLNGDGTIEARAFAGRFGGPGGEIFAHHGHLDETRIDEVAASFESRLSAGSSAGLTLVERTSSDLLDNRFDRTSGVFVIDNHDDLRRMYRGAELRYRARWKTVFFSGSYTWSESRGNIDSTSGLAEDFDFPVLSRRRSGWLSGDARQVVQTAGWCSLPWRMRLAWDFDWVSGYPWTVTRRAFPYGEEFLSGRGASRLPAYHELDMSLARGFEIGRTEMRLVLSVQNVLDTEIVTEVDSSAARRGRPLEWQTPRRFELGTRVTF